jgi:hypothetical protein
MHMLFNSNMTMAECLADCRCQTGTKQYQRPYLTWTLGPIHRSIEVYAVQTQTIFSYLGWYRRCADPEMKSWLVFAWISSASRTMATLWYPCFLFSSSIFHRLYLNLRIERDGGDEIARVLSLWDHVNVNTFMDESTFHYPNRRLFEFIAIHYGHYPRLEIPKIYHNTSWSPCNQEVSYINTDADEFMYEHLLKMSPTYHLNQGKMRECRATQNTIPSTSEENGSTLSC